MCATISGQMTNESPLPPVPPSRPEMQPVPPMSNALGIWAVILTFTGCCTLLGLILGIIGICKYPAGSPGRTLSIIATVLSILFSSGGMLFQDTLLHYVQP